VSSSRYTARKRFRKWANREVDSYFQMSKQKIFHDLFSSGRNFFAVK